jgi:hypothetical protein
MKAFYLRTEISVHSSVKKTFKFLVFNMSLVGPFRVLHLTFRLAVNKTQSPIRLPTPSCRTLFTYILIVEHSCASCIPQQII